MSSLNDPENFNGRVNYAAAVISRGGEHTRTFDNCFENFDGDAVVVALMRRAQKNVLIASNIPRYLNMDLARKLFEEHGQKNLSHFAAELREKNRRDFPPMIQGQINSAISGAGAA